MTWSVIGAAGARPGACGCACACLAGEGGGGPGDESAVPEAAIAATAMTYCRRADIQGYLPCAAYPSPDGRTRVPRLGKRRNRRAAAVVPPGHRPVGRDRLVEQRQRADRGDQVHRA